MCCLEFCGLCALVAMVALRSRPCVVERTWRFCDVVSGFVAPIVVWEWLLGGCVLKLLNSCGGYMWEIGRGYLWGLKLHLEMLDLVWARYFVLAVCLLALGACISELGLVVLLGAKGVWVSESHPLVPSE